jgi:hypothetical protein
LGEHRHVVLASSLVGPILNQVLRNTTLPVLQT